MRQKKEAVLSFESSDEGLPKVVRLYRERFRAISQVLDANPAILTAVDRDLQKLSTENRRGRKGDFTSENIFRTLIVQQIEGLPLRDAVIRIGNEPFLQDFCRMRKKPVMDFSFLDKCFLAIRPETWKQINELLGRYAVRENAITPDEIRMDTTVVETNIHYPTEASLLWDTWRTASRLLKEAAKLVTGWSHRYHDRKVKKLFFDISRYSSSKSQKRQRQVKQWFRKLIERAEWIVAIVREFCPWAATQGNVELLALGAELEGYLPAMETVVSMSRRAKLEGKTVPASERVFSIFEQHTELIKRGKQRKPVEFGHKVLLCESKEKFITDYEVYENQPADCHLPEPVIKRHKKLFGKRPKVLAGDKGTCPEASVFEKLSKQVETLAIPRRMRDLVDKVLVHWQAFRAGIEGTISGLKRAFRLVRCYFHGFKGFSSAVGLGVLCHNLILLADGIST